MDVRDVISRGPFVQQIDLAPAKAQICGKARDKQALVSFCEKLVKLVDSRLNIDGLRIHTIQVFPFPFAFARECVETKLENAVTRILGQPRVPLRIDIHH